MQSTIQPPEKIKQLVLSLKTKVNTELQEYSSKKIKLDPIDKVISSFATSKDNSNLSLTDKNRVAFILLSALGRSSNFSYEKISNSIKSKQFAINILKESYTNEFFLLFVQGLLIKKVSDEWAKMTEYFINSNVYKEHSIFKHIRQFRNDFETFCNDIADQAFKSRTSYIDILKNMFGKYLYSYFGNELLNKIDDLVWEKYRKKYLNIKNEADHAVFIGSFLRKDEPDTFTSRFMWLLEIAIKNERIQKPFKETAESILGYPPNWSMFSDIPEQVRVEYEKLIGLVPYKYFQMIAAIIFKEMNLDRHEKKLLNSRTIFWTNYHNRINEICIFLPDTEYEIVQNKRNTLTSEGYVINDNVLNKIGRTEYKVPICFLFIEECLFVEFFRGSRNYTLVIDNALQYRNYILAYLKNDDINRLREEASCYVYHQHTWMAYLLRFLKDQYNIEPINWKSINFPKKFDESKFASSMEVEYRLLVENLTTGDAAKFSFNDIIKRNENIN